MLSAHYQKQQTCYANVMVVRQKQCVKAFFCFCQATQRGGRDGLPQKLSFSYIFVPLTRVH